MQNVKTSNQSTPKHRLIMVLEDDDEQDERTNVDHQLAWNTFRSCMKIWIKFIDETHKVYVHPSDLMIKLTYFEYI
jgi:hypothetical protein